MCICRPQSEILFFVESLIYLKKIEKFIFFIFLRFSGLQFYSVAKVIADAYVGCEKVIKDQSFEPKVKFILKC